MRVNLRGVSGFGIFVGDCCCCLAVDGGVLDADDAVDPVAFAADGGVSAAAAMDDDDEVDGEDLFPTKAAEEDGLAFFA